MQNQNAKHSPTILKKSTSNKKESINTCKTELLKPKKATLNPQSNDNSVTLSSHHKDTGKNPCKYQILDHLSTILIGKILIFHQRNKIINSLK